MRQQQMQAYQQHQHQEPQLEHGIQARPTLEHLTRTLPHTALSENKAAPTLEEEGKGEGRGGGGRGNSRIVLVHRGPGRFPWVQDMEKCPRRVNAVLPCRRVPNEAIDSNANAPAIDSKDRHRLDKSRYMQGERQTCAEKEVQSVSAIKLQSSATRRRKKTLQTRRRVILCDVASPWSRPCSRRLAHSRRASHTTLSGSPGPHCARAHDHAKRDLPSACPHKRCPRAKHQKTLLRRVRTAGTRTPRLSDGAEAGDPPNPTPRSRRSRRCWPRRGQSRYSEACKHAVEVRHKFTYNTRCTYERPIGV